MRGAQGGREATMRLARSEGQGRAQWGVRGMIRGYGGCVVLGTGLYRVEEVHGGSDGAG